MLLLTLVSCVFVHDDCPHCDDDGADCEDVAMREGDGSIDECDLAACEACADACGEGCAIQESYPPRYVCDEGSWDVYDFCPDWSASEPYAEDVADLGCGADEGESLAATAETAGRIEVTHLDYAGGCCPDSIEVGVTASGSTLQVDYTLGPDPCDCYCMLDIRYDIAGVESGTWTVVAGGSGASVTVAVP